MRGPLRTTLGLSLAAHGAVVVAFVSAPKPGPRVPAAIDVADTEPVLAGDTFELPAPALGDRPTATDHVVTTEGPSERVSQESAQREAKGRVMHARRDKGTVRGAAETAEPNARGEGTRYGAVGERSATDLATTFARAFTQTASEDPAWQKAPMGPAGSATVTLSIDPSGHIESVRVGGTPSAALSSSIARTMALVRARLFTAQGATTEIHLGATITTGPSNDGLEEGRYGLAVHGGQASFVLPIGRRIELQVK